MSSTVILIIHGKVQGVFYRQTAREKARQLGITGFVMNQPDRTVLLTATGSREQLDAMIRWCREGPAAARVEQVQIKESALQEFPDFSIRK